jgi:beta-galactosidase
VAPEAAGADGGPRSTEAEPRAAEADAEQGVAGVDAEPEFTGAGAAFLPVPLEASSSSAGPGAPEPDNESQADGPGTRITTGADDEARAGEHATEKRPAEAEPLANPAEAETRANPAEAAPQANPAEAETRADKSSTEAAPKAGAEPPAGESGRWFRPARPGAPPSQGPGAPPSRRPDMPLQPGGPGTRAWVNGPDTPRWVNGPGTSAWVSGPGGPARANGLGTLPHPGGPGAPPDLGWPGLAPPHPGREELAPPPGMGPHPGMAPPGMAPNPSMGPHPGGAGLAPPPDGGRSKVGADKRPEEREAAVKRRISRRTVLQASLIGGAGAAALPLLALVGGITRTAEQPTDLTFSLNSNWLFGGQYMAGSESSFHDDGNFAPVTVPHAVTQLSWQNWDFPAWQQVWIYRRHFSGARLLDPHRPGNRIFVDFDGVMVNASVTINDQVVTTHQGGYLPFSAELTGKVTGGDNLLAVIVDSRCLPVPPVGVGRGPASVDFFQPGGIYRDVRLRVLPQVFLSDLFALPADVLTSQPRVDVECAIDSGATTHASGSLLVELLDGQAQITAQVTNVKISAPGITTSKLSLTGLGPVRLWSPDSPKLYTVRATLSFPGLGSHVVSRRIGFREASFQPAGFFLNGKRLPLFGLNRHQLYPYAGMAMPARVQRKDAEILKNEFNCNMVRCSHYPQSPDFLDACDELGLLVWEEAPGWHNVSSTPAWQDLVVQNVRDMVIRDRSRPSVIIWGTRLNETRDFPALWAATRQAARELDSSRPSSGAMAYHQDQDVTWNEDVFAYNDYGTNAKTGNVALRAPFAGVPYLVTEAVGVEEAKPQHFTWTDPPALLARQAALHGQAQSQARSDVGYAGLLAWAGFDYASMLGQGKGDVKWAGVADGFRVPKPGAAIYQTQGDPAVRPVIVPVFFWEAGGAAPGPNVMIASNCDRLEVFIGGTHVASATPALDSPLYSGLVHPPFLVRLPQRIPRPAPDLLVQGFADGQQVTQLRMSADPAGDALAMAVDDVTISADGSDATRAVFRAIDTHGNQRRYGSGQVAFTLSGPATLVGDNPFAFGEYGGLGAVWIRSLAGQPGAITLTASHPLLGQAEVQLRSEQANHASELA